MKVQEAIAKCNELKPNQYEDAQKICWLDELDQKIWNEVILSREMEKDEDGKPLLAFHGYHAKTDCGKELLADAYCELYIYYLMSKIDFFNGETKRYNVDAVMFNEAYQGFANHYYRTHKPRGTAVFRNM